MASEYRLGITKCIFARRPLSLPSHHYSEPLLTFEGERGGEGGKGGNGYIMNQRGPKYEKSGRMRNQIGRNALPDWEECAARLEGMR